MKKYRIEDYIKSLEKYNQLINSSNCINILDKMVNHMTYNSKDVEPDCLFICKGSSFKIDYLIEAIKNGAFAYISTVDYNVDIPCILVENIQKSLCLLSQMYFDFPDNNINVIGITGTKGKSTTAYYTKYVLDEWAKANLKNETAILSSIDTIDGVERFESTLTTPESYDIMRHFYNASNSNMENIVMEVSSQSLAQRYGRLFSIEFDVCAFLNISEDHISNIEHPDFEDYFNSKLQIFKKSKIACVNLDSDYIDRILKVANDNSKEVITFSAKDKNADIYAYNIHKEDTNTVFNVKTKTFEREFVLTMPGLFNVENALATIAIATALNIPDKYIYMGLKIAKSSGRMEIYKSKDKKIITIVDYAHNKLSFEKLYESVKNEYEGRKITTVFGCPGNKAFIRRRDLGTLAGMNSDKIYLVAEDPGYESVENISKDIAQYIEKYNKNYVMIEDRGDAIKDAINTATLEDTPSIILVTGKGNETRQKYGNKYVPCKSDVEYVKEYLNEYDKQKRYKLSKIK